MWIPNHTSLTDWSTCGVETTSSAYQRAEYLLTNSPSKLERGIVAYPKVLRYSFRCEAKDTRPSLSIDHREKEKRERNNVDLYPAGLKASRSDKPRQRQLRPEDSQGRWGDSGATVFQQVVTPPRGSAATGVPLAQGA